MLIMIDGPDGSGKGTIINHFKKDLSNKGIKYFDLKKYWLKYNEYPKIEELMEYEYIFSCEPTYAPMGKIIRFELINNNNSYPASGIADGYSLDRLILYKKILIPLLNANKKIIQDRGVSTSLAYQPLHSGEMNIHDIANLTGNKLALKYSPNHLMILQVDPEKVMERLNDRKEKQDDAVFEKIEFQKKLNDIFSSNEYKQIFESHNTKIHYLSTDEKIDIMKEKGLNLINQLLT